MSSGSRVCSVYLFFDRDAPDLLDLVLVESRSRGLVGGPGMGRGKKASDFSPTTN